MARHGLRAQRDLFAAMQTAQRLTPETRQALLALLEALLREVAAEGATTAREGGDEQGHA
jgi:hypothetical protein